MRMKGRVLTRFHPLFLVFMFCRVVDVQEGRVRHAGEFVRVVCCVKVFVFDLKS